MWRVHGNRYYGLRPHGWVTGGSLLIAGVRSDAWARHVVTGRVSAAHWNR